MEDIDARIESYLNTMDAMEDQINRLESKLLEINKRTASKATKPNLKILDTKINQSQNAIYKLQQEIQVEKDVFRGLTAQSESADLSQHTDNLELIKRYEELTEENRNLTAKKNYLESQNSQASSEFMRVLNPKIHSLMNKAIQIEDQNQLYRNLLIELEEERTRILSVYAKITQALNLDDKTKQKVKDLEDLIQNKTIIISKLEERLNYKIQDLKEKEYEIANSEEQLLKENNQNLEIEIEELIKTQNILLEEIKKIDTEIIEEKLRSNVLSPKEAHFRLKEEAKKLETEIIEKNKILKHKDKALYKLKTDLQEILKKIKKPKSRNSIRPSSHMSTPRLSEYRITSTSAFSMTQQSFAVQPSDPRRNTIISKISKEGITKDLMKTFRTVGKPEQSLGSKIVELNRGLFLTRFNSTPAISSSRG
ncbi:unnamed protein product [Blepharisma stoltei]|uniref:Uncharacterized protein n=1 Tax=Blepharisma stoltei TaxID=1481888 RepID=A0AAU9I8E1_9CILI|nr:unnamed protein product [Blepharisma stoltei]